MKTFINGRTFAQLEDKRTKHFEFFLEKGVVAKEFFLRDDSTETFSVSEVKEHDFKSTDQVLMKVTIRLDDKIYNVKR